MQQAVEKAATSMSVPSSPALEKGKSTQIMRRAESQIAAIPALLPAGWR